MFFLSVERTERKKPSFSNPLDGLPCLPFRQYAFELVHGSKNRQDAQFYEFFLLFALSAESKKLRNLSVLSVSAVSRLER
jgi:hypothetical protein